MSKHRLSKEAVITTIFFLIYTVVALSMVFKQPFGNPPDEYNRYLIPQYIAQHGTLPNGYDEAIRIGGYGFSYGFQPILPYIFQGYAMRIMTIWTQDADTLLYTARLVDFVFGFLTAFFVIQLSRLWFNDRRLGWIFTFLVTFLPQSIFLHTYVNTDSCCMLSIAIMLYGLTKGIQTHFTGRSCVILSVGIILCALSYYNAYGYILSCILLFFTFFMSSQSGKLHFTWKPFLQKGILISGLVLLGISWWFIRSYILYDGDILGLEARHLCATYYAIPEFHPDTMVTYQNQGISLWDMVTKSDFMNLSFISFIAAYGPMTIVTSIWIYRFYKALFVGSLLLCVFIPVKFFTKKCVILPTESRGYRLFFHGNMMFCMLMPLLLSIYYSYTTDFQPQGRYLLPILLPFAYYCIHGIEKGYLLITTWAGRKIPDRVQMLHTLFTGASILLCGLMVVFLCITVYGYAFPYYDLNPIAP